MAKVYADRVKETSTTTGTGTYDLAGAATGYQGFVAGAGDGNTCIYVAEDGTDWEVGLGTITDATPDTLSRDTIYSSSNSGSAVSWSAGTRNISLTWSAEDATNIFSGGRVLLETQTLSSGAPGSFDFSSIPGTYNKLILEGYIRGDVSATVDSVYCFVNGDTTVANYHRQASFADNNAAAASEAGSDATVIFCPAATSPANSYALFTLEIKDYAVSSLKKSIFSSFFAERASLAISIGNIGVLTSISDPITSVSLLTNNDPTDQIFGEVRLYGEN